MKGRKDLPVLDHLTLGPSGEYVSRYDTYTRLFVDADARAGTAAMRVDETSVTLLTT